MRHFVLPGAVALGACGMIAATTQGQLVTPAGGALLDAPGLLCAPSIAVDVATVATRADQHLSAAARAEIQAPGWIAFLGLSTEALSLSGDHISRPGIRAQQRAGYRMGHTSPLRLP